MTKAVRIHETGGTEVLRFEEVELGSPGPGEALVRHTAIGLNFIDTYHRTGLYAVDLPAVLGMEAAGVVEAVASDVEGVAAGDRVTYESGPVGAYAEERVMAADRLVRIPDGISDEQAAAVMVKGLTAEYLVRRTYPVQRGETILVHAAAGGVGLILCQWAHHLGARVIGTVGSDAKAELHGSTVATTPSSTPERTSSSRSRRSPEDRGCRWSTTRWARRPGRALSRCCGHAA